MNQRSKRVYSKIYVIRNNCSWLNQYKLLKFSY